MDIVDYSRLDIKIILDGGDEMKANEKRSTEEIKLILANAKTTMAIEGFAVTEKETEIVKQYLEGSISEKEVVKRIKGGL